MNSWAGFIMALAGIASAFTGLFIPPQGMIDGSILVFVGQCFIFSATLLGVKLPKLPMTQNKTTDEEKSK